jgi:pimeloyl-ACP methyl ester carboxylesterase
MRAIRWTMIGVLALVVIALGAIWWQQSARYADASPASLAAATSDSDVSVEHGRYLTFRPLHVKERLGVIVYPGAYVDIRGYAPTLKLIAAAGYRVVVVPMPFDLAILGINRAEDVQAANADVRNWVILGHSVGGAAAAAFANLHRDAVDGVIIWDSYPPSSLADFQKPVWHIHRAMLDGTPPEAFARQRDMFPRDSKWIPIPGGIHMNFGSFSGGGYQEDWAPGISQAAQHALVVAGTLQALADIER